MEFPTLVYRCPGEHQRLGGTYSYLPVKDKDQYGAAISEGWFPTLPQAIDWKMYVAESESETKAEEVVSDDTAPPTRAELEQKAAELGIKFDGRTGDKKLGELIEAKLKD